MKVFFRVMIGLFFIVSGLAKLSSLESFELYVFSFGFAGFDLCSYFARILIVSEILLGILLSLRIYEKQVKGLTLCSLVLFSIFLIWRMLLGDNESCHCMGNLVDMNPVQSLLKNLVLSAGIVYVWKEKAVDGRWKVLNFLLSNRRIVTLLLAVICAVTVFAVNPPDSVMRIGRDSHDLVYENFKPVADSLGLSEGRKMVFFYSSGCEHCRRCASKMSGIVSRHDLPLEDAKAIFMQTSNLQDSVIVDFFNRYGSGLQFSSSYLHPYRFIPLTNGSMPLVVLMENGKPVKEYDYISIDETEIRDFFSTR